MTGLNSSREEFVKKKKEALTKLKSFREDFMRKQKKVKADLDEASKTWKELSERFRWWKKQELP